MNYKKILVIIGAILSMERLQAFTGPTALRFAIKVARASKKVASKQYTRTRDLVSSTSKKIQDTFKVNDVKNIRNSEITSSSEAAKYNVQQAARTDATQTSSGVFNFAKNNPTNTSNTTHNHNYGSPGWGESFFVWMQKGDQTRSAAAGLVVGGVSGYGIHAVATKPVERIIVVQAPSQAEGSTLRAAVNEIKTS